MNADQELFVSDDKNDAMMMSLSKERVWLQLEHRGLELLPILLQGQSRHLEIGFIPRSVGKYNMNNEMR